MHVFRKSSTTVKEVKDGDSVIGSRVSYDTQALKQLQDASYLTMSKNEFSTLLPNQLPDNIEAIKTSSKTKQEIIKNSFTPSSHGGLVLRSVDETGDLNRKSSDHIDSLHHLNFAASVKSGSSSLKREKPVSSTSSSSLKKTDFSAEKPFNIKRFKTFKTASIEFRDQFNIKTFKNENAAFREFRFKTSILW